MKSKATIRDYYKSVENVSDEDDEMSQNETTNQYIPLVQEKGRLRTKQYHTMDVQPLTPAAVTAETILKNLGSRLEQRKKLILRRRWLVDVEFVMAVIGISLMMIENELFYLDPSEKMSTISLVLKTFTSITTGVLLIAICLYYQTGMEIRMLDGGVDDPFAVTPFWTYVAWIVEVIVCAVHPFPSNIEVVFVSPRGHSRVASIDGILSVLMMFRLYLVGKFIVVHSRLLTDPSTQSIGALSRIKINLFFVFKSAMSESPGILIVSVMLTMYTVSCWSMRTCEMYYTRTEESQGFSQSMWLSAITFLTVGYGDVTPQTHCGRYIAIMTGLCGLASTALLVAVIAKRLEQTRSERYVFNFLSRIHLENKHKNAAADVVKCSLRLWVMNKQGGKPTLTYTYFRWKLRNAVREMRSARATLAENEESTVGVIELSHMISRMTVSIEKSLEAQNRMSEQMTKIEKELQDMRSHLK
ncbi:small conductance calcium-activated potassium channel protein 2 isoform X1 [Patella vulgata]|uniref:small conductance calcium-activated potassium channel protein 2 isoform X1 n=2 Tax=Patella vulgata TaxID=6465 RepID=UPI00217F9BB5|nr:small conductance calcium-activated potassium channel protein 2 isoform X1 [Patella vulgata]